MTPKKLHLLILLLILPLLIQTANYKTRSRRGSSYGSSSAASSSGGSSGGSSGSPGVHGRHSTKRRQTNVYASNKLQEFSEGFGKSFGGVLKSLWDGGEEEISIVSGKKVKTSFDSRAWNSASDYDIFSNTLVYTSVALGMFVIIYVFFKKHNNPDSNTQ